MDGIPKLQVEAPQVPGSFTGHLDKINLPDLLQMLSLSGQTAEVCLECDAGTGRLFFDRGKPVHAQVGNLVGAEAFHVLYRWRAGEIHVRAEPSIPRRTIADSLMHLLMHEAKELDEQDPGAERQTVPIDLGTQAFELDEYQHLHSSGGKENKTMASLTDICKELVSETPDAVASNVVDLGSGMMLGGFFTSDFTTDHFEAVSAAATNLYRGKDTLRVEELVKAQRGDTSDRHFMEEVQFSTTHLLHFIKQLPGKNAILCLVTRKPGNIGMGWAALKAHIGKVTPLVPS